MFQLTCDRWTNRQTDWGMDKPSYKDARTHLKRDTLSGQGFFLCTPASLCSLRSLTLLMSGPILRRSPSSSWDSLGSHIEPSRPSFLHARTGKSRGWSQIFFKKVRATNGLRFDVNSSCRTENVRNICDNKTSTAGVQSMRSRSGLLRTQFTYCRHRFPIFSGFQGLYFPLDVS